MEQTTKIPDFLEYSPTTIFLIDDKATIIYCNHHAVTSFGVNSKKDFAERFLKDFSAKFQSNIIAKDFMAIQISKAMTEGMVRFGWEVRRDFHISPGSIRLVHVNYEGQDCCVAYLSEFEMEGRMGGSSYFNEPVQAGFIDHETWSILDSMPFAWGFIDFDYNLLDCNMAAVRLFEAKNKQDFVKRFSDIFPAEQSCGNNTSSIIRKFGSLATEEGLAIFELQLKNLNGDTMPAEITFVRTGLQGRFVLSVFVRDLRITKALEAQKAFEEARINTILENVPTGISIWDKHMNPLYCNDKMGEILGFYDAQGYMDNVQLTFPETQPCGGCSSELLQAALDEIIETGHTTTLDWVMLHKDGTPVPIKSTLSRIEYDNKRAVIEFCMDVSLDRIREDFIRKEADRFRFIFNSIPAACTFRDEQRNMIMCNAAVAKLFELDHPDEYMAKARNFSPVLQPCGTPSRIKSRKYIEMAFETGHVEFEWMHQKACGEPIPCIITLTEVEFEDQIGILSFIQDMRATKAKEELLTKEAERFRIHFDGSPACTTIWDENRNLTMCNHAIALLFGLPSADEFTNNFQDFSPKTQPCGADSMQKAREHIENAFKTGLSKFFWMHQKLCGEPVPCQITLTLTELEGKPSILGFVSDLRAELERDAQFQARIDRLNTIFEHIPMAITVRTDKDGIIYANKVLLELYGYDTVEDFLSNIKKTYPEYQTDGIKTLDFIETAHESALKNGHHKARWVHIGPDGKNLYLESTWIHIQYGEEDAILTFSRDIREEYAAKQLQAMLHERLQAMIDTSMDCCFMIDRTGRAISCNAAAFEYFEAESLEEINCIEKGRHAETQPYYDGELSENILPKILEFMFGNDSTTFNWVFQSAKGASLPARVSTRRVTLADEEMVIIYAEDMRLSYKLKKESQRTQEMIYAMVDLSPIACLVTDDACNVLECNQMALQLLGAERKEDVALSFVCDGNDCDDTRSSECLSKLVESLPQLDNCRLQLKVKGEVVPSEDMGISCKNINLENVNYFVLYIKDLKDSAKEAEEKLKNRKYIVTMLDSSPLASFIVNREHDIILSNEAVKTLLSIKNVEDFAEDKYKFCPPVQQCGEASSEKMAWMLNEVLSSKKGLGFEWVWQNLNGELIPCRITLEPIELDGEDSVIVHMQDLRQMKEMATASEALEKMAYTDGLTGAHNRRFLDMTFSKAFANSVKTDRPLNLIMIDLDDFKSINTNYGYQYGDAVLKILVSRIRSAVRKSDFIYRYGGDEFVIILPNVKIADAKKIACLIKQKVTESDFLALGKQIPITVSVGVTLREKDTPLDIETGMREIYSKAGSAINEAKNQDKNRVIYNKGGKNNLHQC
jgi:diguanylate cyclase (GGDEF)-like protein/PAS domain S-box-containing protein